MCTCITNVDKVVWDRDWGLVINHCTHSEWEGRGDLENVPFNGFFGTEMLLW